ncbi:MAG TPA: hypothetical protein VFT13_10275 [Candidatus Krumholzibacteria bacterium]|nr:hypothetical protein [Candidatus Krumholzibacteria bacterium]
MPSNGYPYSDRPDTWAAIAPMSGVLPDVDYQLPRLVHVPVHVSIGGAETPAWVEASRTLVETMKARGMTVEYFEPAGATHGGMIEPTTPQALEFFSRHVRRAQARGERGESRRTRPPARRADEAQPLWRCC